MKTFYLAAALLMTSTAAYASNSVAFDINGQKVRIDVPQRCDTLSCVQIEAPGLSKTPIKLNTINWNKLFNSDDDDDDTANSAPATPAASPVAPAPAAVVSAPQAGPAPAVASQASTPAPTAAAPGSKPATIATITPAPARTPAAPAATAVAHRAPAVAAAPPPAAATPVGIWRTEGDKGNVRITQCGANLCGYALGSGEKILINMKPGASKWIGRIHDPDSGRNYNSSIAMQGPNRLKVRGCVFGGLFCGGQIWRRVS
ncbi:MAG: DUF2147 domain-containing protein [Bradyrhizobium sp.]